MPSATQEFFKRLGQLHDDDRLGRICGALRIDLTGPGTSGVEESWRVVLARGTISVGQSTENADCVVETDRETFERVASGELNATTAILQGMVKAEGAVDLLLYFQRLFPSRQSTEPRTAAGGGP